MKLILLFIGLSWGIQISAQRAQFSMHVDAVGIIYSDTTAIATAFIIRAPDTLMTCAHVFKKNPNAHILKTVNKTVRFTIIKTFPEYDLAFLKTEKIITDSALLIADTIDLQPGSFLTQFGLDTSKSSSLEKKIIAYGTRFENQEFIDFMNGKVEVINFYSNARPGYSGGPIVNMRGEIVAFTVKYATGKPDDDGKYMVQGFSILPVKKYLKLL